VLCLLGTLATFALVSNCIGVSQKRRDPMTATGASPGVMRCPHGVRAAADGDIDDFEDVNEQLTKMGGRDGYWWAKKDESSPAVAWNIEDGGADGSEVAMHFTGTTAHGSGDDHWGAGMGVNLVSHGLFYDASKYAGIAFKAKAGSQSTRTVRFKIGDVNTHQEAGVCKSCWNHFGADLTLTGDWRDYTILFSSAQQEPGWGDPRPASVTPSKLISLDWTIGPGQVYDLWLDSLVFVECKP
jgi:Carbohydrate binding domain (family 11)